MQDKLIGTWICGYSSLHPNSELANESFKIFLSDSTHDKGVAIKFDVDGKRTWLPKGKIANYKVDENKCKIIYGRRKKPRSRDIADILYIDEKYLILKVPNPHSYSTLYFRKKL